MSLPVILTTPFRDPGDQLLRDIPVIWDADRAFVRIKILQLLGKDRGGFTAGIKADVLFERGKVDQIPSLPVGRHLP